MGAVAYGPTAGPIAARSSARALKCPTCALSHGVTSKAVAGPAPMR